MTDRFLRACRRQPVDRTPVWFMRQAGRYMADYRALRERHSLLELCRTPELATRITLQPVDAIDVDAAIIFSDLLLPFEPMGLAFDFVKGEGPRVEQPLRTEADIERLRLFEPREGLGYVLEAIAHDAARAGRPRPAHRLRRRAVHPGVLRHRGRAVARLRPHQGADVRPPRGVAPAVRPAGPGGQRVRRRAGRSGRPGDPDFRLVGRRAVGGATTASSPARTPRKVFAALKATDVPTIHFGTGTSTILPELAAAGGDVIGIDWRLPIDVAWEQLGAQHAVQGNLDPTLLLGPRHRMLRAAEDVLERAAGRPGHIFNLGHGILPASPLEHVQVLARFVHGFRAN